MAGLSRIKPRFVRLSAMAKSAALHTHTVSSRSSRLDENPAHKSSLPQLLFDDSVGL